INPAVADLPADADHERRPDQCDVAVDPDRGIGDALLKRALRRNALRELRPTLRPQVDGAVAAPPARGHTAVWIDLPQHRGGVTDFERREQRADRGEHGLGVRVFRAAGTGAGWLSGLHGCESREQVRGEYNGEARSVAHV